MTRADETAPNAAYGIAATIGVMLCALLAALLGVAKGRPRAGGFIGTSAEAGSATYTGVMEVVLRAAAEIDFEVEPYVEWIAVPAPWRNGRLLPKRHARMPRAGAPRHIGWLGASGPGPPVRRTNYRGEITGMA